MSGPVSLEIAQTFYRELTEHYDILLELDKRDLENIVYFFGALLEGGWIDLDGIDADTLKTLKGLPSFGLYEMYLDSRSRTLEEVTAAKVAVSLT